MAEGQDAGPVDSLEGEERGERLDDVARRHGAVDDGPGDDAVEPARVGLRLAMVGEDPRDEAVERRLAETSGEPMAKLPVAAVGPNAGRVGKGGIGPGIPGPE